MDSQNNNLPNRHTTPENYEAYCQFIEALAKKMKWKNPVSVEIAMFGKDENGPNSWRKFVKSKWDYS